jgi:hypothetical protein
MNAFRTSLAAAFAAATVFAASAASAYERWVDIVNWGNSAIYSVEISNVDDPNYGRDLLGNYMIRPGDELRVEPDFPNGYCRFDMRITFETGRQVMLWGVNLCEATAIYADEHGYDVEI